jgi:uncharacterized protein
MIYNRTIEKSLIEWKNRSNRKPLVIRGARQVGKTTLIRNFSESYDHRIMLNLELASDLEYFLNYKEIKPLLESLFLSRNIPISALNHTLLFIDEIQESPEAIQMLRYMYEEFPELHVISAGSLLEFAMRKVKSFPVGRVEFMYLHPLNFLEYLAAIGHQTALEQLYKTPLDAFAHNTLLDLFNRYAILGGMPEVLKTYLETKSITELPTVYESIWGTFKNDVEKYASNETERKVIKHIVSTAHHYLDQRIKFHNFGQSNYRSREVGEAFRNLDDARIIQLIYPTTDIEVPIKGDLRKSPRLQFLDTGLINHELGIQAEMLAFSDLTNAYKGAIIPHLVTQEIISLNTNRSNKPHFWIRDKKQSSAEVDIVYGFKDKIIPIEVKSGKTGTLRSLHQFIDRCSHPYAIRMYAGEFKIIRSTTPGGKSYYLMNMPYYLGTRLPEYIKYFVESYRQS